MRAGRRPDAKLVTSSLHAAAGFDLNADPQEAVPLPVDDPRVAEVRGDLEMFAASVGPLDATGADTPQDPLAPMDAAAEQRLRELGYL